jgi:uncharacterized protein YacL
VRTSKITQTKLLGFSPDFFFRIGGMFLLAYVGWEVGSRISLNPPTEEQRRATLLLALSGAGLGLLTTHKLLLEPLRMLRRRARTAPILEVITVAGGILTGLIFALLLTVPLSHLPEPFSQYLPVGCALLFIYLGGFIFAGRRREIYELFLSTRRRGEPASERYYLVDTNAIIDGRIADVLRTGFLEGTLVVPRFVLNELHLLADSPDTQKRVCGKRGLEILNRMQKESPLPVEISTLDAPQAQTVDQKLIVLGQQQDWSVITNDYNLNRVAELQHVRVLNLNQLADAVRLPVVAGDVLQVEIREEGREREQGVGYLEDGTMVVVEDARVLLSRTVQVVVSRVWQTDRGRMIFGRLASTDVRHR